MKLLTEQYSFFNGRKGGWALFLVNAQGEKKKLASGSGRYSVEKSIKASQEWQKFLGISGYDVSTVYDPPN